MTTWTNWAGLATASPAEVRRPHDAGDVVTAVREARERGQRVKMVGTGHSFTDIALTDGVLLLPDAMRGITGVDRGAGTVTALAGTTLRGLNEALARLGLSLHNMGDVQEQTLAGAISTGTHGTGSRYGGIATQVVAATLVTADGELLTVSETENADMLPAVALGLGALGILVDVTLQCVPAFTLHAVERPEPLDDVVGDIAARADAADHFEFYWFPHTDIALTKTNERRGPDAATHPLGRVSKLVDDVLVGNVVHQAVCSAGRAAPALVPGINRLCARVWGDRSFSDASHRVFATSRGVRFREMEYAVPVENLADAFRGIQRVIADHDWRIEFPIEVRTAAADDLWLSTASGRASGYIAVHRYWKTDPTAYFRAVEEVMLAHGGRPHWGKMHTQDAASLRSRYPRFDDFTALRDRLDPDRLFRNPYLTRVLGE